MIARQSRTKSGYKDYYLGTPILIYGDDISDIDVLANQIIKKSISAIKKGNAGGENGRGCEKFTHRIQVE
ncbi:MAG: hypothetical protein HOJ35_01915 [Bdellovibrionales bacterium]|nr:hypothetical protein [Bdellovibrionales bacterium]